MVSTKKSIEKHMNNNIMFKNRIINKQTINHCCTHLKLHNFQIKILKIFFFEKKKQ